MFMSLAVAAHQTCELECKAGVLGRPLLKHSRAQDLRTAQSGVMAAPVTAGVAVVHAGTWPTIGAHLPPRPVGSAGSAAPAAPS